MPDLVDEAFGGRRGEVRQGEKQGGGVVRGLVFGFGCWETILTSNASKLIKQKESIVFLAGAAVFPCIVTQLPPNLAQGAIRLGSSRPEGTGDDC